MKTPTESSARGTRLDADIVLTDEWGAIAADEGVPGSDLGATFREFVGHWTSLPGPKARKLDWAATWRNRCIAVAARSKSRPPRLDEGRRFGRNSMAPVDEPERIHPKVITPDSAVRAYQERLRRERAAESKA